MKQIIASIRAQRPGLRRFLRRSRSAAGSRITTLRPARHAQSGKGIAAVQGRFALRLLLTNCLMNTSRSFTFLAVLLLLPWAALAQQPKSEPIALPKPVAPAEPAPAAPVTPAPDPSAPLPKTAATPPAPAAKPAGKGGMILNFQNASLGEVLNYLSEAAGFVVVQEAQVSGTVNVMSRQEISAEEAVDLLNTVLLEKGYIAIRNGRILKIVSRKDAQKKDLPVRQGSDPEQIPRKDEMVTQIMPLRYGEAAKLVENLQSLLSENATISANESANSIILTDTQTNIRRIATIIKAIDTSVASISTIHVFPLRFADAKGLATIVTQLFQVTSTSGNGSGRNRGGGGGGGGFGGFGGMFGGGGPGGQGGGQQGAGQSEARQAASRIVAVADEQSNSLIVSAPAELIPEITDVIEKLDTSIEAVSETRIFRLLHADSSELAETLTKLYGDTSSSSSRNGNQRNQQGGRGGGFFGGFPGQQQQSSTGAQSERSLLQAKVVAVGDPRTNSLVITAAREQMIQIAETVARLDSTDAKKQRVYTYRLQNADPDTVANVLRGVLGDASANSSTQQNNVLNNRSSQGATMDTSNFSNSGGGGGGGGGGGRGGR